MQCFWGKDEFGAREEIERIAQQKGIAIRWVDKEALAEKPLSQWVDEGVGGLFGKSLVVGVDPADWLKSDQEALSEIVAQDPKLLLVWQRGALDKRAGWYSKLKKAKKVREFSELSAGQVSAWVREYAQEAGGKIEGSAAGELVSRVGADRWALTQELDKLVLRYEVITQAAVREMVPAADMAGEIFVLLDALAGGKRQEVMRRLTALLASGESEFYVLSMLSYQLRTLLVIRSGQESGQSERQVVSSTGLHPYVVQKNWRAAQRWSRGQLVALMTRLLATDAAIKRGVMEPKVGVTMLMAGAQPSSTV